MKFVEMLGKFKKKRIILKKFKKNFELFFQKFSKIVQKFNKKFERMFKNQSRSN